MVMGEIPLAIKIPTIQPLPRGGRVVEHPVGMPIKPPPSEQTMARSIVANNMHSQRILDIRRQLKPAQFGLEALAIQSTLSEEINNPEVAQQESHRLANTFMSSMFRLIRVGLMLIGL